MVEESVKKWIADLTTIYLPHHFLTSKSLASFLAGGVWAIVGAFIIPLVKSMSHDNTSYSTSLTYTICLYVAIAVAVLLTMFFERSGYIERGGELVFEEKLGISDQWPRLTKLLFGCFLFSLVLYMIIDGSGFFISDNFWSNKVYEWSGGSTVVPMAAEFSMILTSVLLSILFFSLYTKKEFPENWKFNGKYLKWMFVYVIIIMSSIYIVVYIV